MDDRLILVTGATGYIASRLIPRLLEAGHPVRCLARDPARLRGRSWLPDVEVVKGQVTEPATLIPVLAGVHTAYYLIHNMTYGRGYADRELEGARAFAAAAGQAGVSHIIYLGGLADPDQEIAPHMRSRIETGQALREGGVPVTEFRAGVIVGSGSISFEMIRFMTELFPLVPGPAWLRNRAQPIAIRNVIDYLLAALGNGQARGGVFEIGGPDVMTYGDLMLGYARLRGLRRRMMLMPGIPVPFMALGVGLMTPVPRPIAHALIEGLANDSVVRDSTALRLFPEINLLDFDSAARDALSKTHPTHLERIWEAQRSRGFIKHEGCFILHFEAHTDAAPGEIFRAIEDAVRGTRWCVDAHQDNRAVLVQEPDRRTGTMWIEWRLVGTAGPPCLTQTTFFAPRGLPGFLRWYLWYPLRVMRSRQLLRRILGPSRAL